MLCGSIAWHPTNQTGARMNIEDKNGARMNFCIDCRPLLRCRVEWP
jgi:hypothetical protein